MRLFVRLSGLALLCGMLIAARAAARSPPRTRGSQDGHALGTEVTSPPALAKKLPS